MTVLYFAYGSCMSPEELARDVSDYSVVSPARVRGFRLGFTRYSRRRRGGVADLVPDIDGGTEGVLYRLPRIALPALDEREGAPDHYRRDFIAVRTVDGKLHDRVLTYVVVNKRAEDIPPHPDYVAAMLDGAVKYLSPGYLRNVQAFIAALQAESAADAGRERRSAREPKRARGTRRRRTAAP